MASLKSDLVWAGGRGHGREAASTIGSAGRMSLPDAVACLDGIQSFSLVTNFNFTVMHSVYVMTSFVFTPRVLAR